MEHGCKKRITGSNEARCGWPKIPFVGSPTQTYWSSSCRFTLQFKPANPPLNALDPLHSLSAFHQRRCRYSKTTRSYRRIIKLGLAKENRIPSSTFSRTRSVYLLGNAVDLCPMSDVREFRSRFPFLPSIFLLMGVSVLFGSITPRLLCLVVGFDIHLGAVIVSCPFLFFVSAPMSVIDSSAACMRNSCSSGVRQ